MNRQTQQALAGRVLSHVENKTTDLVARERALPTLDYLDPQRFSQELRHAFAPKPALLAHTSQLREPGDFLTDTVNGQPIIVTRRADGSIGAYANVCRHRGAQLVAAAAGSAPSGFSCNYHAWHYDLDGALTHVPDQKRCFPGLELGERGLLPVPAQERFGFIWAGDVEGHLAPLATELDEYQFGSDQFWGSDALTGTFNWKLGVEAFLEVYHFRSLHPAMKNYVFVPEIALFDQFGDHVRIIAPKKDITALRDVPPGDRNLRPYATAVYFIFPATFLFVEKRHASTLQIRPVSPDTSEVRILHFAREDGLRRPDGLRRNIGLFLQAVDEDLAACVSIQKGLSAVTQQVLFGRNEVGIHHFRDMLDGYLAGGSQLAPTSP